MGNTSSDRKWTVQVTYTARHPDTNAPLRARTVIQIQAPDVGKAYTVAEQSLNYLEGVKLGAILPGHHSIVP